MSELIENSVGAAAFIKALKGNTPLFARNQMVWPFDHFLAFYECRRKHILRPVLAKYE